MSEGVSEERIREIVRDELQKSLLRTLNETLEQIRRTEEHLSKRQEAYEGRMGDLERNIRELAEVTGSLAKTAQENTKAIEELRITVTELGKRTEENTKAITGLVRAVKNLNKRVGGLENTFGLIVESSVNSSLVPWFRSIGVNVDAVSGKTLLLNGRLLEFDTYVETEGKIFVGEIKTTLREDDVTHFHEKIVILKTYLGGKDVVPFMVYRNKYSTKRGDPIAVAKTLGIKVLKYTKGGGFFEAGSQ